MNTRSDYIAQQGLAEGARNKTAPLFTPTFRAAKAQPIPSLRWWLLTLAPWLVVGVELAS